MRKLLLVSLAAAAVLLTGCPRRPRIPRPPGIPFPRAEAVLITDLAAEASSNASR